MAGNVTTQELEIALQQLANQMGVSVTEYVQSLGYETVAEVQAKINSVQSQIDAIVTIDAEDGIETLAEKIELINQLLSAEEGATESLLTQIVDLEQLVLSFQNSIDAIEAQGDTNATDIETLQQQINSIVSGGTGGGSGNLDSQLIIAQANAYTDAMTVKASTMNVCAIANSFRVGLGLAPLECGEQGGTGGAEPDGDGLII